MRICKMATETPCSKHCERRSAEKAECGKSRKPLKPLRVSEGFTCIVAWSKRAETGVFLEMWFVFQRTLQQARIDWWIPTQESAALQIVAGHCRCRADVCLLLEQDAEDALREAGSTRFCGFWSFRNLEESFRLARRLRPRLHIAVLIVDGSGFVACRFWFALLASKSKR